jgi:adenylate cyclase
MERRLSAILAADIVGYSAQMERDEAGTFARLTERRREIFEPEIARHQGRIFKTMGDGILAEFGSVVQAVECAVAIQTALEARNAAVPAPEAIRARIGINLGEVIVDGDDRYGEGVNLAARLEGLADPGGICVSEKVAREVEKKLAFGFVPMGAQKVKNIADPVMAYRVQPHGMTVARSANVRRPRARHLAMAAGLLVAVLAMVAAFVLWPAPRTARDGPPVLAVLPFDNLTGDPARDYLRLAVPDGIVTILSSSPVLRVSSRSASLSTTPGDTAQQIAWRLGADLLLEGSLRQGSLGCDVSARLIDGATGDAVWTATFGQQGADVAALQEAVARGVYVELGSAGGAIADREVPLSWQRMTGAPAEYDVFLRGAGALLRFDDTGRTDAYRIVTEGIAAFPDSALLGILLAALHYNRVADNVSDDVVADIDTAWALLTKAGAKRDMTTLERWMFHYIRALVGPRATGDHAAALQDAITAQTLVPFEPQANMDLSQVASDAGRPDLGLAWATFAVTSDPRWGDWGQGWVAWAHLMAGDTDAALRIMDGLERNCRDCQAVALVRGGRIDEARTLMAEWRKEWPEMNVEAFRTDWTGRFPQMVEPFLTAYLDDLRTAGVPEAPPPPP